MFAVVVHKNIQLGEVQLKYFNS